MSVKVLNVLYTNFIFGYMQIEQSSVFVLRTQLSSDQNNFVFQHPRVKVSQQQDDGKTTNNEKKMREEENIKKKFIELM